MSEDLNVDEREDAAEDCRHEPSKRRIARFLVCLALCVIGLAAVLALLSALFAPKHNGADADTTQREAVAVTAEPENSLDVLLFGDSVVKSSVSPLQMYDEAGFSSYVVGAFSQRPHIGYSLLQMSLEEQNPRVVVLETDTFYQTKYNFSNCVMQLVEDAFPVFKYHDRWKQLSSDDFFLGADRWVPDPAKGYYVNTTAKPADASQWMAPSDRLDMPMELSRFYMWAMVEYCKTKGVIPVLLSSPSTVNMSSARHNALQKIADELGVQYIDLNAGDTRVDVQWDTETRDGGDHLNYYGAVRVSRHLAKILDQRFDLPDHRGDRAYASWSDAYQSFVDDYPEKAAASEERVSKSY